MDAGHDPLPGSPTFRLLGPIEVDAGDGPIALGGTKQRRVLATLLLHVNEPLPTAALADYVWPSGGPSSAAASLHAYVYRLRKLFDDHGVPAVIERKASGYRLECAPSQLDVSIFRDRLETARAAMAADEWKRAAGALKDALALWRGRALADLHDAEGSLPRVTALEEDGAAAAEHLLEARLVLEDSRAVLPDVRAAVERHPARERLWGLLMLALYRAGRQADALDTYRRARSHLREHHGVEPGPLLRAVERAILRQAPTLKTGGLDDVPPEETAGRTTAVPLPDDRFVGREVERSAVAQLVREARLVTLTGPPGAGKTRLALQVVARDLPGMPAEVVDLASVRSGGLVERAVAVTLGVRDRVDRSLEDSIVESLSAGPSMLVLDNAEHVLEGVRDAVSSIIERTSGTHVLVTSRRPLGLAEEATYGVRPLATPDRGDDVADVAASPSVRLLLDRIRRHTTDVGLDATNVRPVANLTRRLDGLPLAIEMIAAHARDTSLEKIERELANRLDLEPVDRRDGRHRSLRAALAWSVDLLDAPTRGAFAALGVFAGPFTGELARDVVGDGIHAVRDELDALAQHSLLATAPDGRHRLLDTVRAYAREELERTGRLRDVQDRHARACLRLVEAANDAYRGPGGTRALRTVAASFDDIRVALNHACATGDAGVAQRLASGVRWFAYWKGNFVEALSWLEAAAAVPGEVAPDVSGDMAGARAILNALAGNLEAATELMRSARAHHEASGDPRAVAVDTLHLGSILALRHLPAEGVPLIEEAISDLERLGAGAMLAEALATKGMLVRARGDLDGAVTVLDDALAHAEAAGHDWGRMWALFVRGKAFLDLSRPGDAREDLRRALDVCEQRGDVPGALIVAQALAGVAALDGDAAVGGRLVAGVDAAGRSIGYDVRNTEPIDCERIEALVRGTLDDTTWARTTAEGHAMDYPGVLELARQA